MDFLGHRESVVCTASLEGREAAVKKYPSAINSPPALVLLREGEFL
jgi:hypothetical protein